MLLIEAILNQFSRLTIRARSCQSCMRHFTCQGGPLQFRATEILRAEPPKRKARISSQAVMLKEMKRRARLEKSIKKLKTRAQIAKPIVDICGERSFIKNLSVRERETVPLSFEESERRAVMYKAWCKYKKDQHAHETNVIHRALQARENALNQLREVSDQFYLDALKMDSKLIPYTVLGPVHTPSIPDYLPPDGEVINTTRVFEGETQHPPVPIIDHKYRKS